MNDLERLEQRVRELEAKLAATTPSYEKGDLVLVEAKIDYRYMDGDYRVVVKECDGFAEHTISVNASQIRGRV